MTRIVILFLWLSFFTSVNGQTLTVKGTVRDTAGRPIPAQVSILRVSDSSRLQTVFCGFDGSFLFQELPEGNYYLEMAAKGFRRLLTDIPPGGVLALTMEALDTELEEVVIKSNIPEIRAGLGKTTIDFDQEKVGAGDNALDLLRRSPGVTVSGDGTISMNGKGVLVMIDNRQVYLSGEDLQNYLRTRSAESIARIELISQPSARYEAEGNTGIINFISRKNARPGLNGSLSGSFGQSVYPRTHNAANLGYSHHKLNLYADAGYLRVTGFLEQKLKRRILDTSGIPRVTHLQQESFLKETFEDYSLRLGADYQLTERLKVGGQIQGIHHPNKERDVSSTVMSDALYAVTGYNRSVNDHGFLRQRGQANIYGLLKMKHAAVLNFDLDYISLAQEERHLLTGHNFDAQQTPLPDSQVFRSKAPFALNVFVLKTDYSKEISKDWKLEGGLRTSSLHNQTDVLFEIRDKSTWVYDSSRSNKYHYQEQLSAAYLSLSGRLADGVETQVGLRAEYTQIKGIQEVGHQAFDRAFLSLFPSLIISCQISARHRLELDAGRRVSRPSYRQLNPFREYLTVLNYRAGNPDLLPEFRNRIALRYNYGSAAFAELSYSRVNNIISPIISYDEASGIVYTTLQNYAFRHNLHGSAHFTREMLKGWQFSLNYDWYFNEFRDSSRSFLASSHGHSIGVRNEISFDKWAIQAYYTYNSGDLQSISERNRANHWFNGNISRKIWRDTAIIRLSFQDPFDQYRHRADQSWNNVDTELTGRYATQSMAIGFTYQFGKAAELKRRERTVEEVKRM